MIQRVITAFSLLGIGIVVIGLGGIYMWLWVLLVALASTYEIIQMAQKKYTLPVSYHYLGYLLVTLSMVTAFLRETSGIWSSIPLQALSLGFIAFSLFELFAKKTIFPNSALGSLAKIIGFVAILFPYIYLLRATGNGLVNFIFVMIIVWACDIFALFGGKYFGRRQLSMISPKKTIEGTFIGISVGMAFAILMIIIFHLPVVRFLLLGIVICTLSQLGDLHESLIKRYFDVKDSSTLLPGHGGFYDRTDSAIFVCPFSFYLLNGIF